MMKLNIGCGGKILEGYENYDKYPLSKEVKYLDFNESLPFDNKSVDEIIFDRCLHLAISPNDLFTEFYRICKKDAIIQMEYAHFSNWLIYAELDTIKGYSGFIFGSDGWNHQLKNKFTLIEREWVYRLGKDKILNFIFNPLINTFPMFYEKYLSGILPCTSVKIKLKVNRKL